MFLCHNFSAFKFYFTLFLFSVSQCKGANYLFWVMRKTAALYQEMASFLFFFVINVL